MGRAGHAPERLPQMARRCRAGWLRLTDFPPPLPAPRRAQGVAMSAVATIAGNAGLNMQKWGFLIEAKKVSGSATLTDVFPPREERQQVPRNLPRRGSGNALIYGIHP